MKGFEGTATVRKRVCFPFHFWICKDLCARSLTVAVLFCIWLTACTASNTKPATYRPRTDAVPVLAERQGVDFLLKHQNADGSWGTFASRRSSEVLTAGMPTHHGFSAATTALVAKALGEPAQNDANVRRALGRAYDYLLAVPVADRAHPEVFYEVWAHTFRAEAMAQLLGDDHFEALHVKARRVLQSGVESLCALQSAEGGVGYYDFGHTLQMPTGQYSTAFNTACAMRALVAAKAAGAKVPPTVLEQMRRALLSMRSPERTFLYSFPFRRNPGAGVNRPQGAMGRTGACLLALAETGEEPKGSRRDMVENSQRFRDNYAFLLAAYARPVPHETYYHNAGYFVTFGLYHAAQCAERMGGPEGKKFATWQAAEIAALQSDVGSWMDFPLYGYGQYYSTAFALLALQANARTLR